MPKSTIMTRLRAYFACFLALVLLLEPTVAMARASRLGKPGPAPAAAEELSWPTVAANPQRTSWTPEQVPTEEYLAAHRNDWNGGMLYPLWYRPIGPFINGKVQVIAANGLLYLSTARGLYALAADSGEIQWVYPTELPLGHSPTVANGVLYVGGFDRKIHAVDAVPDPAQLPIDQQTGYRVNDRAFWTYEARGPKGELGAGFETNPLVVDGIVYAGNRDGYLYAIFANDYPEPSKRGTLYWRFKAGGPIRFSAAYQGGLVFFAAEDSHAYAVRARTDNPNGELVWRSAKFPGAGFQSYWPVVYQDWVIFAGSHNYVYDKDLILGSQVNGITSVELADVYPNHSSDPRGVLIGPRGAEPGSWVSGTVTLDATKATEYFETKPERRTYFVLDRLNGQELALDTDGDGNTEYAPILWAGTHSASRYPPVLGNDGVLYQQNNYISDPWIAQGEISGWKFGTQHISVVSSDINAVDEPMAYAAGGNLIYWDLWGEGEGGSFDLSIANSRYPEEDRTREWKFFDYNLDQLIPGYNIQAPGWAYGGANGIYGERYNPPIPYQGKLFWQAGNCIIAFSPQQGTPRQLPLAQTVRVPQSGLQLSTLQLDQLLEAEVVKILDAGHLRPGYHSQGLGDLGDSECCVYVVHYFHNSADTIYTLIRALPYLSPDLQQRTRAYIQQEFANYPPYSMAHIGWRDGAAREDFDVLPEVAARMADFGPQSIEWSNYWSYPQYIFYALWKYAEVFGDARPIFDQAKDRLQTPPSDSYFLSGYTHNLNGYIAGYIGYLELQRLAGYPESASVRAQLDHLLDLRATQFSKDHQDWPGYVGTYMGPLHISRNFMYMVPELADYLRAHALAKVQAAVDEYHEIAPYWFVSRYDSTYGEGVLQQLYDYSTLFHAKAWILGQSREELAKYLDVPAFPRGDLFYIQNLVTAIEAPSASPGQSFVDVPPSHPYFGEIEGLYQAGYTAGCSTDPLMYCPEQTMNRAESSVFVERGVHTASYDPPAPSSQVFADMPLNSWAAKWVNGLWQDHYTAGCGTNPLIYCPWQGHTRAEGCVFYLRMLNGANFEPPQVAQQTFADVPVDAWYAKWAQAAYDAQLITACQTSPDLRFCPDGPLSRGLAAHMMVQAKGLSVRAER